jgi:hypothetical protein
VRPMTSPLRQQIEDMEPRRYARAAKRAAELAKQLADETGTEVSPAILHLAEATEDEIATEREQQLAVRHQPAPPADSPVSTTQFTVTIPKGTVHGQSEAMTSETPVAAAEPLGEIVIGGPPAPQQVIAIDSKTGEQFPVSGLFRMRDFGLIGDVLQHAPFPDTQDLVARLLHGRPSSPGFLWPLSDFNLFEGETVITPGIPGVRPRAGRLPSRIDWEDYFADAPKLEKGHFVTSSDESWRVGWLIEGALSVSVAGDKPWETRLEDDDVVRVDPEHGLLMVETRRSIYDRKVTTGVAVVLRISSGAAPHVQILQWLPPVAAADEQSNSPYDP